MDGGHSNSYPKTLQRCETTIKLDETNLLPEQQYGFRKNRSTTVVPNILNMHIIEAKRKKEYSVMLSLDISRAYDTCWRRRILNTLKTWKINGRMLGFAKNFMSNRTLRAAVGNRISFRILGLIIDDKLN
jgi:hypothetical protein